ncbi:hypothetical protein YOLOSWAG_151 [Erwinia phage vB_EamM_Yoloswag]|uniref:Uncharacterized protein n=1 Tax=Erwinia phage vB_EamM_Yoloswag TaxID=1958956 RepID=A0A1S6L368_9CAUD|nr:hypothetical protein HOR66_gp151 [Erwinia phage vB_EamM_Yoloswag]AQT28631.1 hypothetical protein YOLOSWAG_151 [Erwinia phage vB_EamM_Yoloswag]
MPVTMNSFLVPVSTALPFLIEDKYVRGGMRCLAAIADRDAIVAGSKKAGMLVYVTETQKIYQLATDLATWEEAKLGGGAEYEFQSPLVSAVDADGKVIVGLNANNSIPGSPGAGYTLVSGPNQTLLWIDFSANANQGVRYTKEYEMSDYLTPGQSFNFELQMARTNMLLEVTLNAFDIELTCHTTNERNDRNPYLFRSSTNFLSDEGVREEDGEFVKGRRYSFISNTDGSQLQYWSFKNIGTAPAKPKLTVTYLVME